MDEETAKKLGISTEKAVRLIPYHSIGRAHGLLRAVTVSELYLRKDGQEKKIADVTVAVGPGRLSRSGGYQMILHPALLEEKKGADHDIKSSDIHYIGGADVLPAPLETEQENEVIQDLATEEYAQEARSILIEHNLRLVVYIAKKFDNTGVGVEDLISIGTIGLIKSINTFNPGKNIKLATYASRCIENEILMYLRRNHKTRMEVSIDEPLNVDWDGNELLLSDILGTDEDVIYRDMENEAERRILRNAVAKLSERERTIVSLRFGLDTPDGQEMTQKEVAAYLGISQSYISRLEKKIMKRLKKEMVRE